MALDPNIALQVKPIEIADPLASYGRVAAIQNAQNQNALAQYQLGAAQRAEARDIAFNNALAAAGTDEKAIANALLKAGKVKEYGEFLSSGVTRLKAQTDLVDAKLKQSRQFLDNVTTPEQYVAWHQANHADPILGPTLAARGVTAEQSLARIQQALKTPGGFQELLNQSKLGVEKFLELNKPHVTSQNLGGTVRLVQTPGLGGAATVVPGSSAPVTMTEFERQKLAQDATGVVYQEDANGNIVALPSRLKVGELPKARVAMAPGGGLQPLTAKPSEAVGKEQMSLNQQNAVVKSALDYVKDVPSAFSLSRGLQGETVGGRFDSPEEIKARSYVFNVVSNIIKERAGTAQSAGEKDTLNRFLPSEYDNDQQIKGKLEAFQQYLADKETGTTKKKPAAAAAFPGAPKVGTVQDGYRYKGGNPAEPSSWERQ